MSSENEDGDRAAAADVRRAVERLAEEILGLPLDRREERLEALPAALARGVAEVLIERAARRSRTAPEEAADSARLGLLAAECARLDPREAEVADLCATGYIALGVAAGELERAADADAAFLAAAWYLDATPVPGTHAAFCAGLAELRARQGRSDEAAALFRHAADLEQAAGESRSEAPDA